MRTGQLGDELAAVLTGTLGKEPVGEILITQHRRLGQAAIDDQPPAVLRGQQINRGAGRDRIDEQALASQGQQRPEAPHARNAAQPAALNAARKAVIT
jgi:hypothetical protein